MPLTFLHQDLRQDTCHSMMLFKPLHCSTQSDSQFSLVHFIRSRTALGLIRSVKEQRLTLGQFISDTFVYVDELFGGFPCVYYPPTSPNALAALGGMTCHFYGLNYYRSQLIQCFSGPVSCSSNEDRSIFRGGGPKSKIP